MKISSGPIAVPIWTSANFIFSLGPTHKTVIYMRDHLALLIAQGRTYHHEHHRAGAAGLVVNLFHRGAECDLIAGMNRRDELDIFARIETLTSKARHALEEMAPIAEGDRKPRRCNDSAIRSFLRGLVIDEERIGLTNGLAELGDLLARHRHRIGGFKDLVD